MKQNKPVMNGVNSSVSFYFMVIFMPHKKGVYPIINVTWTAASVMPPDVEQQMMKMEEMRRWKLPHEEFIDFAAKSASILSILISCFCRYWSRSTGGVF